MKKIKSAAINATLILASVMLTVIGLEFALRQVLFSENEGFRFLKDPALYAHIYADDYADIFTEEYWLLYYVFGGEYQPPPDPHPLLGWTGYFHGSSYRHFDEEKIAGRRPVLFYGDSFSQCVESVCFEKLLNNDTAFARDHYLLNYGVGGYGLGQIYLLSQKSIPLYEKPFVVFGFMTRDLERGVLSFRTGQKPMLKPHGNELLVKGVPIQNDPMAYYETHSPEISSYLYRLFTSRTKRFFDWKQPGKEDYIEEIKTVNRAIILQARSELEKQGLDYVFLIFHPMYKGDGDWRNGFIRDLLEEEDIPYIWAKDLVENDTTFDSYVYENYEIPGNGHPTTHQNQLICNELKRVLLSPGYMEDMNRVNSKIHEKNQSRYDPETVGYYEFRIRKSDWQLQQVKAKAESRGISLDNMITLEAEWLRDQYLKQVKD